MGGGSKKKVLGMIVECPSCAKEKEIEYAENIICDQCKSSFFGHTYKKFKKPLLSASAALFIGAFGGYKVGDALSPPDRYPLPTEYQLVNSCVNSSARPLTLESYARKQEICLCAVEATTAEIDFASMRKDSDAFVRALFENLASCK